jgi:hypothetical protein
MVQKHFQFKNTEQLTLVLNVFVYEIETSMTA